VAHRGSSEALAEHTLGAYRRAVREGADALECDVRLTADGHLVCLHDRRVERTSDGRGVVSSLELADLHDLDFASWKGNTTEVPDHDDSRRVLTLNRLLDMVAAEERRVEVAVETKHPTRYAGLVERRLVELLESYGWGGSGPDKRVRVMSYSWASLRRVHERAPGLTTVYLMDRVPLRLRDGALPRGVRIAGLSIDTVREYPQQVPRLHANGNQVHVHVVNEDADVRICLSLGVDAIITDRPGHVRTLVDAG
jgi:glycerophosphoryl diester phosphodiesterase